MGNAFKIGRAAGIDVKVHWTFIFLLAFAAFIGFRNAAEFGGNSAVGIVVTIAVILALFLCVVLHEFGHSLVAQRLGINVTDITLLPIGGVGGVQAPPPQPPHVIQKAVAPPLV